MTTKSHADPLSPGDYEALSNLRYALRKFTEFSSDEVTKHGLTSQQHQALLAIKGNASGQAMTVGMLAERLLIAPHTATELVGRLVDGGYIVRQSDPGDKRRQTLQLTEKADDALHRLSAIHLKEIRDMAPELVRILIRLQSGSAE